MFPACILPVAAIRKKVKRAGSREEDEATTLMSMMQETFSGIRVVKSAAREEFERSRFNAAHRRMLNFILRWKKATELSGPLVETVASVGIAAGLVYAKVTGMSPDTFLLLNMSLMSMYPHIKALSRIQATLQRSLVASSRVFALIDEEPEIRDAPNARSLGNAKGNIQLNGVSFQYPEGETPAVRDLELSFETGKQYALVGKRGRGKSTILS